MPDLNSEVRTALRATTGYIGGIERETTITTVIGTRSYDKDTGGFPSDFMADEGVHDDTNETWLKRADFKDRLYTTTGAPKEYYIRGRKLWFEREPDAVIKLTFFYRGTGDDVTTDEGVILAELSLEDDDPLWKAIIYEFVHNFWEVKYATEALKDNIEGMKIAEAVSGRYEKKALRMRHEFLVRQSKNQSQGDQTSLPSDYFPESTAYLKTDHGRVFLRR